MQSTSAHPGADHQIFWGVIQPVNAPFWDRHRPGDRWNCQCGLRQTDEEPTDIPSAPIGDTSNSPSPGLDNNPGKDGILFNDHHPYFPKSCASCPFAATGKKIFSLLDGRKNSCYECKHVSKKIHVDKERNKEIYKKYLNNPDYYGVKYDEESGGVLAIHKGHNFDKQNGAFGISRGEYEIYASNVLFKNGYRVIMQNEQNDIGVKSADMLLNGVKCDIKGIEKNGKFTIKSSFRKANSQESEIIALYFHDTSKYSEVYINEQWNIFMFYNKSPLHIKEIICISKDDIISKFEIKKSGLSQVE